MPALPPSPAPCGAGRAGAQCQGPTGPLLFLSALPARKRPSARLLILSNYKIFISQQLFEKSPNFFRQPACQRVCLRTAPLSLLPPRPAKPRASPQRLRGRNWRQTCQKIWSTDWQQAGQDAGKRSGMSAASRRHPGREAGADPPSGFPRVPSPGSLPAICRLPGRSPLATA